MNKERQRIAELGFSPLSSAVLRSLGIVYDDELGELDPTELSVHPEPMQLEIKAGIEHYKSSLEVEELIEKLAKARKRQSDANREFSHCRSDVAVRVEIVGDTFKPDVKKPAEITASTVIVRRQFYSADMLTKDGKIKKLSKSEQNLAAANRKLRELGIEPIGGN